jgi:hypothetical protein
LRRGESWERCRLREFPRERVIGMSVGRLIWFDSLISLGRVLTSSQFV